MIFSIYIYFTSFIYLFIFFAFAIGDLYDFLGRAVSAETTNRPTWQSRGQHQASRCGVDWTTESK